MAVLLSNSNLTHTKATIKPQAFDRNSSKLDSLPAEQQQQQQSSPAEFSSMFPLPPKRVRRNPILLKINTSPLITQIQIPPRNPADCPPLSVKKSKKLKKSVSFALPLENKVITAVEEEDGIILGDRNLSVTPTSLTPTSSDSASSLSSSSSSSSNDELPSPCSPITYDDDDDDENDNPTSPSQENNGGYIELIRNPIKSRIWYEDEFFGDEEHLREQQELLNNTLQNMYVNIEPWFSKTNFT